MGFQIPERIVYGGDSHRGDTRAATIADGVHHFIPCSGDIESVFAHDDGGERLVDESRCGEVGVGVTKTYAATAAGFDENESGGVPREGAVGLGIVSRYRIR